MRKRHDARLSNGTSRSLTSTLTRIEALAAAPADETTAHKLGEIEAEWRALSDAAPVETSSDENARFSAATAAVHAALNARSTSAPHDSALASSSPRPRLEGLALWSASRRCTARTFLTSSQRRAANGKACPAAPIRGRPTPTCSRFEAACRRATERHENRQELERVNSRLDALSHEAEQLAAQEDSPAYAWDSVAREWADLEAKSNGLDDAVRQRFAAAETIVKERAEAKRVAAEKTLRQHVQRLEQLSSGPPNGRPRKT